jgi:hypothetical protein
MVNLDKLSPKQLRSELARGVLVLASCAILATLGTIASASDEGSAAADRVSQASYFDFLDTWLYTHAGDNRGLSGPEHDLARDNISFLLESYGLTVTLEPFEHRSATYHNVVGTKTGTVHPDQVYIVGAHFDSVGNPGADDDASGVATVLETARIISRYDCDYTVRFIAFDCEEVGLIGSKAYVVDHGSDDILGMVQADMVAHDPGTNLAYVLGRTASDPIKTSLGDAIDEYGDGLTYAIMGDLPYSDHAPFEAAGFQACLLIESEFSNNPYYHTQQDSLEQADNLNLPFAVRMTRSVVGWVVDQAGMHNTPPAIDAELLASPDPAEIGETITFGASATDWNGDDLAYSWDFGDETFATGDSVTHEYPTDGTYTATVAVSDWLDLVQATVEVTVARPVRVSKLKGKLNFRKAGRDTLLVKGELDLPQGFLPGGKSFRLDVGGAIADFDLDAKGRGSATAGPGKAASGGGKVRLGFRKKSGLWEFRAKLRKSSFAEAWEDEGLVDDTLKDVPVDLRTAVTVGEVPFITTGTFTYSGKSGRSGRIR